jgi:hypothetical protein
VTRLLREHPPIEVELDAEGALVAIRWNGRRETVEVCNRWRVEEAWWRGPIARDYFKVAGSRWLALVYLDRVDNSWPSSLRCAGTVAAGRRVCTRWRVAQAWWQRADHRRLRRCRLCASLTHLECARFGARLRLSLGRGEPRANRDPYLS